MYRLVTWQVTFWWNWSMVKRELGMALHIILFWNDTSLSYIWYSYISDFISNLSQLCLVKSEWMYIVQMCTCMFMSVHVYLYSLRVCVCLYMTLLRCVSVNVSLYMYISVSVHVSLYMYISVSVHVFLCVCMCIMCLCTCISLCLYVCLCTCISLCLYMCLCTCISLCLCLYMCLCTCTVPLRRKLTHALGKLVSDSNDTYTFCSCKSTSCNNYNQKYRNSEWLTELH